LSLELKEAQRKLEEAQLKIQQLHDINGNYTAEVKIQKRINAKLKKEMDVVAENAKGLEADLEASKEKNELVNQGIDPFSCFIPKEIWKNCWSTNKPKSARQKLPSKPFTRKTIV
jgi:hypothetical protein